VYKPTRVLLIQTLVVVAIAVVNMEANALTALTSMHALDVFAVVVLPDCCHLCDAAAKAG